MSPADHIHQTMCVCFYLWVIIAAYISDYNSAWKIAKYTAHLTHLWILPPSDKNEVNMCWSIITVNGGPDE